MLDDGRYILEEASSIESITVLRACKTLEESLKQLSSVSRYGRKYDQRIVQEKKDECIFYGWCVLNHCGALNGSFSEYNTLRKRVSNIFGVYDKLFRESKYDVTVGTYWTQAYHLRMKCKSMMLTRLSEEDMSLLCELEKEYERRKSEC